MSDEHDSPEVHRRRTMENVANFAIARFSLSYHQMVLVNLLEGDLQESMVGGGEEVPEDQNM